MKNNRHTNKSAHLWPNLLYFCAMQKCLIVLFSIFCFLSVHAQKTDSLSVKNKVDSTIKKKKPIKTITVAAVATDTTKKKIDSSSIRPSIVRSTVAGHPYNAKEVFKKLFNLPHVSSDVKPVYMVNQVHVTENDDILFYALIGVFLFLGVLKTIYPTYFRSLYRSFFRPANNKLQSKENVSQNNVSSLLFNLFFVISAGLCISLWAKYTGVLTKIPFWLLWCYASLILVIAYLIKYLVILLSGWVFDMQQEATSYNHIVFLVNKVIGLAILPLILLLAFPTNTIITTAATITLSVIGLLLIYRYVISFSIIRSSLKVSPLHFFIYLCAIEVVPILIIYKILFLKLDNSIV